MGNRQNCKYTKKSSKLKRFAVVLCSVKQIATRVTIAMALFLLTVTAHAVNLASMAANIEADLQGNVNGYAYVLEDDVNTVDGSGGSAIRAIDTDSGAAVPMTPTTRSFIASVTKNITAIATLQLLDENALPITALIEPWLPADWVRGPNIDQVSFKDLLQHRTGFKQIYQGLSEAEQANWGNDYAGLKWIVQNGSLLNAGKVYHNSNFALLRVLIPALVNGQQAPVPDPFSMSLANGIIFADYVINAIFEPSGVAPLVTCSASDYYQVQALAYDVNDPTEKGHLSESSMANCGGHAGLRMSAYDLIHVLEALQGGTLLSEQMLEHMYSLNLGWEQLSNTNILDNDIGKWWHGGAWNTGWGRAYRACVMVTVDGVRASVVTNSDIQGKSACDILKHAYNNAELWLDRGNQRDEIVVRDLTITRTPIRSVPTRGIR